MPTWQYLRRQNGLERLRFLERTQWMSAEELQELQWQRVHTLLEHASKHVPHYVDEMRRVGADPHQLAASRSLAVLPLLDRATVNEHRERLRARNIDPARFVSNATGGSTGEPMRFYDDRDGDGWLTASVWRSQRWLGVDVGERSAFLWGADFDVRWYRGIAGRIKSGLLNLLMLRAWELNAATAPVFHERLVTFKPRLLVVYAGALHEMAALLGPARGTVPGLHAIIVSAEVLTEDARREIEACFNVPVFNRYGGRDLKLVAQECPARLGLHINSESVLVEIVKDGRIVPDGEVGEVVISRLDNFAMPFLRYRTGDRAALSAGRCTCGRSLPLLERLEGRVQDAIVAVDGTRMYVGTFFSHMFKDCPDVRQFQIHQLAVDRLLVQVVPAAGAEFVSRARVERLVQARMGNGMRVDFEVKDSIPLTRSGKRRIIVTHLDV